jgi:hypothetical protein
MRIQLQEANQRGFGDPDPGQTLISKKDNFYMKNMPMLSSYLVQKIVPKNPFERQENSYLKILVIFDAPGSESESAFPIRIRI